jgi:hypothetical protein
MLQKAMDAERISTAIAVAIHTVALSVVRVNGQRRCKRIQIGLNALLQRSLQHVQTAIIIFCAAAPHLTVPMIESAGGGVCIPALSMSQSWLEMAINRANDLPPSSSVKGPAGEELRRHAARQRDQTVSLDPWIAGQQMLVASLGVHMGILLHMADCVEQCWCYTCTTPYSARRPLRPSLCWTYWKQKCSPDPSFGSRASPPATFQALPSRRGHERKICRQSSTVHAPARRRELELPPGRRS